MYYPHIKPVDPFKLMEKQPFSENHYLLFHTGNLVHTYDELMRVNADFHLATENRRVYDYDIFRRQIFGDTDTAFTASVKADYGNISTGYLLISSFSEKNKCVVSLAMAYAPTPTDALLLAYFEDAPYVSYLPQDVVDMLRDLPQGEVMTLQIKKAVYIPTFDYKRVEQAYMNALEQCTFGQLGIDINRLPDTPSIVQ